MESDGQLYLTFRLTDGLFAIPVSQIDAVHNTDNITWVPGCPDYISGVLNFRGKLVSVLDLEARLRKTGENGKRDIYRTIIVKYEDELAAIIIDELLELEAFMELRRHDGKPGTLNTVEWEGIGNDKRNYTIVDITILMDQIVKEHAKG